MFFQGAIWAGIFQMFLIVACVWQHKKGHRQWRRQMLATMILTSSGLLLLVLAGVAMLWRQQNNYRTFWWLSVIGMFLWSLAMFFCDWVFDFVTGGKISKYPEVYAKARGYIWFTRLLKPIPMLMTLYVLLFKVCYET